MRSDVNALNGSWSTMFSNIGKSNSLASFALESQQNKDKVKEHSYDKQYDAESVYGMGTNMPMSNKQHIDEYGEDMPEINELRFDEGNKDTVYKDSKGFLTVGTGHKLTEEELGKYKEGDKFPEEALEQYFMEDYVKAREYAKEQTPQGSDEEVTDILTNMNFQMGEGGVSKFKDMHTALSKGNYKDAADAMRDSRWYTQTPERAERLATRMGELQ